MYEVGTVKLKIDKWFVSLNDYEKLTQQIKEYLKSEINNLLFWIEYDKNYLEIGYIGRKNDKGEIIPNLTDFKIIIDNLCFKYGLYKYGNIEYEGKIIK